MKSKNMKKLLTTTLAAVMIVGSVLTVNASSSASAGTDGGSSGSATEESAQETVKTYAEQKSVSANQTITVGDSKVKTTVSGVYAATSVQGCAITADVTSVRTALGLKTNQNPVVIIYDTDAKKSNKAMASVNAAVEALGGELITALNIDLGAKQSGKWITLTDGSVAMTVGLPKSADTSKTYSIACVQPGGKTTILENQSSNPKTVVFEVQAGLGTYAIVAQ